MEATSRERWLAMLFGKHDNLHFLSCSIDRESGLALTTATNCPIYSHTSALRSIITSPFYTPLAFRFRMFPTFSAWAAYLSLATTIIMAQPRVLVFTYACIPSLRLTFYLSVLELMQGDLSLVCGRFGCSQEDNGV